jgi:hypothetical protein
MPHIAVSHCFEYHVITLGLYQPFNEARLSKTFSHKKAIQDAERSLNILIRLYLIRHSFDATDIYLLVPLSKLGFLCLKYLQEGSSSGDELEYFRSTLALLFHGLISQGQHAYITRVVFKLLKNLVSPVDFQMIQAKEGILGDESSADEDSKKEDTMSAWTPSIISISEDAKSKGLSQLAAEALTTINAALQDR